MVGIYKPDENMGDIEIRHGLKTVATFKNVTFENYQQIENMIGAVNQKSRHEFQDNFLTIFR